MKTTPIKFPERRREPPLPYLDTGEDAARPEYTDPDAADAFNAKRRRDVLANMEDLPPPYVDSDFADLVPEENYDDPLPTKRDAAVVVAIGLAALAAVAFFLGWLAAQVK